MKLTVEDLLAWLPIVADRGWTEYCGEIRDADLRCPLCALAYEWSGGEIDYDVDAVAALEEALDENDIRADKRYTDPKHAAPISAVEALMNAADDSTRWTPALRRALGML